MEAAGDVAFVTGEESTLPEGVSEVATGFAVESLEAAAGTGFAGVSGAEVIAAFCAARLAARHA